ncbi:hypothetical protein BSKO_12711 [Bryopsis sp. KO-2023]|nr:hypothetical protein BSKO_12711 [Bryopsis sp. KO-2023]
MLRSGLRLAEKILLHSRLNVPKQRDFQRAFCAVDPNAEDETYKFCIVGTGPAGFYAADRILRRFQKFPKEIDFIEKLPFPFGLVATGVAPDHHPTKNVINQFEKILEKPECRYFGNVEFGKQIKLAELRDLYHGVILAYGAEGDVDMEIRGEDQKGVFSAREFVWWYNGHPDYKNLDIDLRGVRNVAIFGMGNVALDCARILLKDPKELEKTDIADHALEALRKSDVTQVHILGRRGPAQAKFTSKELRELLLMDEMDVEIKLDDLRLDKVDRLAIKNVRMKKRIQIILTGAMQNSDDKRRMGIDSSKRLSLRFYRMPRRVIPRYEGEEGKFELLTEYTQLCDPPVSNPNGPRPCRSTGRIEGFPVDLILKSIGYKATRAEKDIPFDKEKCVVPNIEGRVVEAPGSENFEKGLYVCGWLKRGPSGIIGTNLIDAEETVDCVFMDRKTLLEGKTSAENGEGVEGGKQGREGLERVLKFRGVRAVNYEMWKRLDNYEVRKGEALERPRVKVVDREVMLDICFGKFQEIDEVSAESGAAMGG